MLLLAMNASLSSATIYMNTADYTAYAARTFAAEKKTIEWLGMAAK